MADPESAGPVLPLTLGEIETVKLSATFSNNLAVAIAVSSFLIPYFTIIKTIPEMSRSLFAADGWDMFSNFFVTFGVVIVGAIFTYNARANASWKVSLLDDPKLAREKLLHVRGSLWRIHEY